jgi:hypothetical protein
MGLASNEFALSESCLKKVSFLPINFLDGLMTVVLENKLTVVRIEAFTVVSMKNAIF